MFHNRLDVIAAVCCFLALLVALVVVPYQFEHAESVRSAAATAGYNNRIAHFVALIFIVATVGLVGVFAERQATSASPDVGPLAKGRVPYLIPIGIIASCAVLYFPPALSWNGPFFEEAIILNALHRISAGEIPFRDFEFLYGPLMLFLPATWVKITGLSLNSYYSYIALLEMLTMLLVFLPIARFIKGFWSQLLAFVVTSPLYFNVMLGPNQNGMRKIIGVLLLISVATNPFRKSTIIANGVGLGFLLAYSQEFGAGTAAGIAVIYLALFSKQRDTKALISLVLIACTSAIVWLATIWLILGDATIDYFQSLKYLTAQFDAGEAAFEYYWTLSGLAVFGLIFLGCLMAGRSLAQNWTDGPGAAGPGVGPLLFIGGVAYAMVTLKSGISRADQWHLVPTALVLGYAFLLPMDARSLVVPRWARGLALLCLVLLTVTYSFGQFKIARFTVYTGLIGGYQSMRTQDRAPCDLTQPPPLVSINCQNGAPKDHYVELTNFLAQPENRDRGLFIFESPFILPAKLGVRRVGYIADGFIYGDERAKEAAELLRSDPSIYVATTLSRYEWLLEGLDAPIPPGNFPLNSGPYKTLRSQLSSVHLSGLSDEYVAQKSRWREFIGAEIISSYEMVFNAGNIVILEKVSSP